MATPFSLRRRVEDMRQPCSSSSTPAQTQLSPLVTNCPSTKATTTSVPSSAQPLAESDRARTIHKARSLVNAGLAITNAGSDNSSSISGHDDDMQQQQQPRRMLTRGQQKCIAVAPAFFKARVQREPPPLPEFTPNQQGDD